LPFCLHILFLGEEYVDIGPKSLFFKLFWLFKQLCFCSKKRTISSDSLV
jgi:hypothetical protein